MNIQRHPMTRTNFRLSSQKIGLLVEVTISLGQVVQDVVVGSWSCSTTLCSNMNCTILLSLSVNSFDFVSTYALQWISHHMPQLIQIYWHLILNHLSIVMASHNLNGFHEVGVENGLLGLAVIGEMLHHLGCKRPEVETGISCLNIEYVLVQDVFLQQ